MITGYEWYSKNISDDEASERFGATGALQFVGAMVLARQGGVWNKPIPGTPKIPGVAKLLARPNATKASLAEAEAAKGQGLRGAASALETDAGVFTGRSTGAGGGPLRPDVQAAYDEVPMNLRSPFHGECGEGRAISAVRSAGACTEGATIVTRTIGGPNHGTVKPPCTSCEWVLKSFKIKTRK